MQFFMPFFSFDTVITRLPPGAYSPLRTAFRKAMSKYSAAEALSILDTCYDLSGYKSFSISKISFLFNGRVSVDLAAVGILYAASEQQVCLAFAVNKDETDVAIFENVQQKTLEVIYDVGAAKLGFGVAGGLLLPFAFAANEDEMAVAIFENVQQKTLDAVYDVGAAKLGFGVAGCLLLPFHGDEELHGSLLLLFHN